MSIMVRQAAEHDRDQIALCIAEGFEKDFSILCKDIQRVAQAIGSGIQIDRFYVAQADHIVVGTMAVSDCNGRAVITDKASYRKHFGLLSGFIAGIVLKEEFESKLEYPQSTGYIEFVAVRKNERKRGVATQMVKESMALAQYKDYALDVVDVNAGAIKCYTNIGFEEFRRVEEKHKKQKGFGAKIYMRYANTDPQ